MNDLKVGGLLSKYGFTESDKFNKLYNASINFIKHWKSKMIFEINDVKKALNTSVVEASLTPVKMPEHDDPVDILKDYFNTALRTFIKFLREKLNKKPRDFSYIIEAHNHENPNRTEKFAVSFEVKNWSKATVELILDRIEKFIVSSNLQDLKNLNLLLRCYPSFSGGANTKSFNEAIYTKRSIIRITNEGNECLWWCIVLLLNQNTTIYRKLIDLRYPRTLNNMARQLCESCGYDYTKEVKFNDLPNIINQICQSSNKPLFNVAILDIQNLPSFNSTVDISNSIMFQTEFKTEEYFYLLFDNNHFSPILNIKQFLNVKSFCLKCQRAFVNTSSYAEHLCEETQDVGNDDIEDQPKPLTRSRTLQLETALKSRLRKDRKLFLGSTYSKEAQQKRNSGMFRYIIWDIEVNQERDEDGFKSHKPNLIVAFEIIIKHGVIDDPEGFVDNLNPKVFEGYDCVERYCEWVMEEESNVKQKHKSKGYKQTICIAHNSRGYDSRFVLKYLDSKSLVPHTIRANGGSSIQQIAIKNRKIIWIDSLNFFNQPLSQLPKTYGIKNTVKGYFPHGFNTMENQNYIGSIPDISYYHPEYTKIINHKGKLDYSEHQKLVDWHTEQVKANVVFNMKEELLKYCIDDCKVLLKAVLIFRNIIIDKSIKTITQENGNIEDVKLDIDPFREAITIPSLACKINRNHFLPKNTIEAYTDSKKHQSKIASHWLYHVMSSENIELFPEFHLKVIYSPQTHELKTKVFRDEVRVKLDESIKFAHHFQNKNGLAEFDIDAFDPKTNTTYEFNGDYWHGNPNVLQSDTKIAEIRYKKTKEREHILKLLGFKHVAMWEDEWKHQMNNFDSGYRDEIVQHVEDNFIDPRNALHGGRTEVFKTFYEAKSPGEIIFGFDISSQYPAVMALDPYAVGVKRNKKYTPQQLTIELLNGTFCGLVKCDLRCPKDMYIPTMPSKGPESRLLFDLLDKHRQEYASPELKFALEEGYEITKVYNTHSYAEKEGLFKEYVECFYKMKIENTQFYTSEECEVINRGFKEKGLNIVIESSNTCNNPGLRGVAKLFLNSLWGKFGTREIMTEYTYVRSMKELYRITSNPKTKLTNFHIIHENLVEVQHERNVELTDPPDYVSPITAVFTTSNARVRLAKFLKSLHPSQVLYCDTDSCYFAYNPNNPEHIDPRSIKLPEKVELGDGLGQWEMELSDGKKWAATGAKSYAVECQNPKNNCLKTKGITIDFKNKDKITFESMASVAKAMNDVPLEQQQVLLDKKDLIKNDRPFILTEPRFRFGYDKKTKTITTQDGDNMTKIIQNTAGLKRYIKNNITYPYGYEGVEYNI